MLVQLLLFNFLVTYYLVFLITSSVKLTFTEKAEKSLVFHHRKPRESWALIRAKWKKRVYFIRNHWERAFWAMQLSSGGHRLSWEWLQAAVIISFSGSSIHRLPSMTISSLTISEGKLLCLVERDSRMWYFGGEAMPMDSGNCLPSKRSITKLCGNPPSLSCMQSISYRMLIIQWWGNLSWADVYMKSQKQEGRAISIWNFAQFAGTPGCLKDNFSSSSQNVKAAIYYALKMCDVHWLIQL